MTSSTKELLRPVKGQSFRKDKMKHLPEKKLSFIKWH